MTFRTCTNIRREKGHDAVGILRNQKKRPHSPDPESSSKIKKTKYDVHTHKMMEAEEIADDLETRHGNCYTQEQYNLWAHDSNEKAPLS